MRPKTDNPDAAGVAVDGKVFYANVQTDTDWIVAPLPTGVETFTELRSSAAPEDIQLIVDVPEGATLRLRADDVGGPSGASRRVAAEVVRGNELLATFTPPTALDAQDRPVAVTYDVKDDRLRMHVTHKGADVAYPITVDPVTENQVYWNNASASTAGWDYQENPVGYFSHPTDYSKYGHGLYVAAYPNGGYQPQQWGQWVYQTQGTSFIYRAEFGYVNHDPSNTNLYEGIFGDGSWEFGKWTDPNGGSGSSPYSSGSYLHYNYKTHCVAQNCSWDAGRSGNLAAFGLQTNGTVGPNGAYAYLGSAAVAINDRDDPTVKQRLSRKPALRLGEVAD